MFSKDTQVPNLMKIRLVQPSCSVRTDGQTDMTKLTVAFRSSPYTPKDGSLLCPRAIGLLFCIVDSNVFDIYLLNCNWIVTRWQ